MVDVVFQDLCLDVTAGGGRPAAVAEFWAAALDLTISGAGGEDSKLSPPAGVTSARTVWVNAVPEAMEAKARVHLDLCLPGGDPAPLLAAGATLVRAADEERAWHVLEDPDGIVLCVFDPLTVGSGQLGVYELVVDAVDPEAIAGWWADRTGAAVHRHPDRPFVWLEGVPGFPFQRWEFNPVPEPKTTKNRVHWDVTLEDATVADLTAAGATIVTDPAPDARWTVLADPEGNEFCVFAKAG
ncbi:VOC family protein [Aquihabitans sp. McL0605]|uniref:VOC family protein n=1 Tax=Aquihabitans sp. McL0605 TaxID=3415671 RepID=UPI003CEDF567